MRQATWSESAVADLRDIDSHLSQFDSRIARDTIERMVRAARWLVDTPGAGSPIGYGRLRKWRPQATRHVLIYEPVPDGIRVVRLFHAAQDWRAVTG